MNYGSSGCDQTDILCICRVVPNQLPGARPNRYTLQSAQHLHKTVERTLVNFCSLLQISEKGATGLFFPTAMNRKTWLPILIYLDEKVS